jgi:phosphoglycolate phosphatase-like HAD superfamily hydrolase
MSTLKAIIFDFDGVLAESVSVKDEAFVAIFSEFGQDFANSMLSYHKTFNTDRYLTIKEAARRLNRDDHSFLSEKANEFASQVVARVTEAPEVSGALSILRYLADRRLLAFISSGAPQDELRLIVKARRIDHFFNGVFGIPDSKTDHIKYILDRYSLGNEECIFVGDTMLDYRSAHAMDIPFIARSESCSFPAGGRVVPDMSVLLELIISGVNPAELLEERRQKERRG